MPRRAAIGFVTILFVGLHWPVLTTLFGVIPCGTFPLPTVPSSALIHVTGRGHRGGDLLLHADHALRLVVMGFVLAILTGVLIGPADRICSRRAAGPARLCQQRVN